MTLRRFYIPGPLLLVALCIGCDRADPLEPAVQAAAAGSGSTPSAPSATSAAAVSESRIDVSWQDNSTNENGFEVHRSTTGPGGTLTLRASTGANVTQYVDAGLTHSTQYCYRVRAFRVSGRKTSYSEFSAVACTTTPAPPPPAAPSGADAWPAGSTAIGIAWTDNSTNEDGFRVERSFDLGASWTTAATAGPNELTVVDGGRTSEQQVCYRVIAFKAGGESAPSNTACTVPPAGPTNLVATIVDASTREVELTWVDASAVEDAYDVWIWPCCSSPTFSVSVPANSTSFRYFLVDPDDYIYVVAVKDGGYSDTSNWVVASVPPSGSAGAPAGSTSSARTRP